MSLKVLAVIAWRNILRHVRHSIFSLLTVALGVSGLVLAGGFVDDLLLQLREMTIRTQLGHLQVTRPGFVEGGAGRSQEFLIETPAGLRQRIEADDKVAASMGRLSFPALLNAQGRELDVEVEGVEPELEAGLGSYLSFLRGRNLRGTELNAAVLGEGAARQLQVGPGDYVTLVAPTVDGAMNAFELEVVGVFRTFSKDFDERAIRIPLALAQDLLGTDGLNVLVVQLHRTEDTDAVLRRLSEDPKLGGFSMHSWQQLSDFYSGTRDLYAIQFGFLRVIAIVLIGMSVLSSFNVTVFERTAEFGTMRALGNGTGVLLGLLLLEAALLGGIGVLVGLIVGWGGGELISTTGIPMPPPPNSEAGYVARILIGPGLLVESALIGLGASVLGALLPALRVIRLPIIAALGHRV